MVNVWPAILYLVLLAISALLRWDRSKLTSDYVVKQALVAGLLYWGGFFDELIWWVL